MGKCKDCIYWIEGKSSNGPYGEACPDGFGGCVNDKHNKETIHINADDWKTYSSDMIITEYDKWGFRVGADFSCIHYTGSKLKCKSMEPGMISHLLHLWHPGRYVLTDTGIYGTTMGKVDGVWDGTSSALTNKTLRELLIWYKDDMHEILDVIASVLGEEEDKGE